MKNKRKSRNPSSKRQSAYPEDVPSTSTYPDDVPSVLPDHVQSAHPDDVVSSNSTILQQIPHSTDSNIITKSVRSKEYKPLYIALPPARDIGTSNNIPRKRRKMSIKADTIISSEIIVRCRKLDSITNSSTKRQHHSINKIKKDNRRTQRKKTTHPLPPHTTANPLLLSEFQTAVAQLGKLHPYVISKNTNRQTLLESCGARPSLTDATISTMLSQNTTDANSKAAYASLKRKFPTWDAVADCDDLDEIIEPITIAGLAATRARRIRGLLRTLASERGSPPCLEYLRRLSNDEVKVELSRFDGIGPKTISCVLLFALGRAEFPVDTHVFRIAKKIRWVDGDGCKNREQAYEYLNNVVPDGLKMDLHCLLVTHGKQCHYCAANGKPQFPPEGGRIDCPLKRMVEGRMKKRKMKEEEEEEEVVSSVLLKMETDDDLMRRCYLETGGDFAVVKKEKENTSV